MHKVILADQQHLFRIGLAKLLAGEADLRIVFQASDPNRVHSAITAHPQSMVIVSSSIIHDLNDFVTRARQSLCRVLVIAGDLESPDIYRSAGVSGVVTRSAPADTFVHCVRQIRHGNEFTSAAKPKPSPDEVGVRVAGRLLNSEKRVVSLLMEGMKNKEIADRLGTSEQVVKNKFQRIFDKTGCSTRVELALFVHNHPRFAESIAQNATSSSPEKSHCTVEPPSHGNQGIVPLSGT
jgi:DNA-binding NarL/FixJ family response regulator